MIERAVLAAALIAIVIAAGFVAKRIGLQRASRWQGRVLPEASSGGHPEILMFFGPKCTACDRQKSILAEHFPNTDAGLRVRFVDAVRDQEMAIRMGVRSVPTTFVTDSAGIIVACHTGVVSADILSELLAAA
ncbi:hypothetical protein BH23CHL5_BH23CHL5_26760 [soil metagenome]